MVDETAKIEKPRALVETVGPYMYMDTGQEIKEDRPTLVVVTNYVQMLISEGKLKLLIPNFPKEANDEDFYETYKESEGDAEFAAASYASAFGLDETGQESYQDQKSKDQGKGKSKKDKDEDKEDSE